MGGFMDGLNLKDLIGAGLDAYKTREQSKVDARLASTREQMAAYELATRASAVNLPVAVSDNKWLILAGVGVAAVVVWMVAK